MMPAAMPGSTAIPAPRSVDWAAALVDSPESGAAPAIPVWQVRVGDVVGSPDLLRGGPRRVVAIGRLPGMRKLFLADPTEPLHLDGGPRLSPARLRSTPCRTLGDDALLQLLNRAGG